ncbi:MAG: FAD-dependent thymidylate synthase [Elusimicrobiota bacterium]
MENLKRYDSICVMKVICAGYNIDIESIKALEKGDACNLSALTPETISAAYARISRDPRPINELRGDARKEVEKSRKSNETIIFGMGHSSVAEHAVFNIDIIGISRLALEALEKFRLASFTEKSQRYITLDNDYVLPKEIEDLGFAPLFRDTITLQNNFYHKAFKQLKDYIWDKNKELAGDPKNKTLLEGWAKEDARYITSLAAHGQVGMTVNARALENMLRRFSASKFEEVRELGKKLYNETKHVAPSIVRYTDPTLYEQDIENGAQKISCREFERAQSANAVHLIAYDKGADSYIIGALLYKNSGCSYDACFEKAAAMSEQEREAVVKSALKNLEAYNTLPREFEYVSLTYELIVSAACFGQLKRHRMATITCQDYNPALGVTIPKSITESGLENEFKSIIEKTEAAYNTIAKQNQSAAEYILTNAHKRRVLFKTNLRELSHISRLREDKHAQWDIQNIAREMAKKAKETMPAASMLICGKDKFKGKKEEIYKQ